MDSITQGVLGASFAVALTPASEKPKKVAWLGALAGMAPDLDVLIRSSSDPLLALEYHRHFTHSLFFVPFGAALCVALYLGFLKARKRVPFFSFREAYLICLAGLFSHALLDLCTSYGTQYLWPFTNARYSWDWIAILDFFYTGVLLAGLVVGVRMKDRRWVWGGLAASTLYILFGAFQHERAVHFQQKIAHHRGHVVEHARVSPSLMNLFLWRSVYRTNDRIYVDGIHTGFEIYFFSGSSVERALKKDFEDRVLVGSPLHRDFVRYRWFSDGMVGIIPSDSDVLILGDFRYGMDPRSTTPLWGIKIPQALDGQLDSQSHIERRNFRLGKHMNLGDFVGVLFRPSDFADPLPSAKKTVQ